MCISCSAIGHLPKRCFYDEQSENNYGSSLELSKLFVILNLHLITRSACILSWNYSDVNYYVQ